MHCHCPSIASFQSVTELFASDTARIFPVVDQLTRHAGTPKSLRSTGCHEPPGFSAHTITFPSCPALAIVFMGSPRFGAQATSLTQSVCICNGEPSCDHEPACLLYDQIFTVLSQPQETSLFTGSPGPCAETSAPGGTAGEKDTAVTPTACAGTSDPICQT